MDSTVKKLVQTTVNAASAPTKRLQRRAPSKPSKVKQTFTLILSKLRTKRSWVTAMFVLGTVDVILNVVNLVQMSSEDVNYGLVIGPPTHGQWVSMCVFTVISMIIYIPETINTCSALYSADGDTIFPLHFELPITILLEHLPLAATNYFVARCRREYTTDVDSFCGVIRVVFILTRLVWYAHIEGKKVIKHDKYEIHQWMLMVCCILFSVAIAFPIMNWRYEAKGKLRDYHLINVSIYMLKRDPPPEGKSFNIELTQLIHKQGWTSGNSSLVPSAWDIFKAYKKNQLLSAYYNCQHQAPEKPYECIRRSAKYLFFQFQYKPVKTISPYGEISYNYAEICFDEKKINKTDVNLGDGNIDDDDDDDYDYMYDSSNFPECRQAHRRLAKGWRLFYFKPERWHSEKKLWFNVSEPFWKVYTSPMPKYDPEIVVCNDETHRMCSKPDTLTHLLEDLDSFKQEDCPEELDLHQRFSYS